VAAAILLATNLSARRAESSTGGVDGAATVQRRDLVETDTESGTLGYADPQTVYDRLGGTITWLPPVGRVIERGQALFEVNDESVILLYGSTPAYRDLDSLDGRGADIRELNANLASLGYDASGIVVNDAWQTATTDGVTALQKSLGEAQTGKIALGQVVFLPGEQLVNTIDGAVGASTSFGSPSSAGTEFVDLTSTTTTRTTTGLTSTTATTTPTTTATHAGTTPPVTQTVTVTVPTPTPPTNSGKSGTGSSKPGAAPSSSSSGSAGSGGSSGSGGSKGSRSGGSSSGGSGSGSNGSGSGGTAILQTSSTRLVATADLAPSSQSEAVVGLRVTVEMPAGSTVNGTITSVSPVATGSGGSNGAITNGSSSDSANAGSGSSATVAVTVTLDRHVNGAGLDQASVSVNFAQANAENVLCVPVTALVATSGATYALREATPRHKLLPVSTGLFAAGYVQISGPEIHPGLKVIDSEG
jgi:hypothetical protein